MACVDKLSFLSYTRTEEAIKNYCQYTYKSRCFTTDVLNMFCFFILKLKTGLSCGPCFRSYCCQRSWLLWSSKSWMKDKGQIMLIKCIIF